LHRLDRTSFAWRTHSASCYCPSQAMLRHTVFDLDLAFSAGYQIDLRCFLTVNFFTVEKRMEVGHLKRSSSMTKSRLTVSSSRPTEWGSSPCLARATAARTPSVVMLTLFGHQPKSHYQPEATVRCELIHKHGFGCRFLSALMQHIGEFFDVEMPAGGMQLVAWCRDGMDDRGLADRLSQAAVVARPVSSMFFRTPARRSYFLASPRGVRTRSIAR